MIKALLNPISDYNAYFEFNLSAPINQQQAQANAYGLSLGNFVQTDAMDPGFGGSSNALYYYSNPSEDGLISWCVAATRISFPYSSADIS